MLNPEYYKLGQKVRNFRKRSGKSQLELETEIGAAPGSLSRIENGEVNPTKETLMKLIEFLDLKSIEASQLMGLEVSNILNLIKIPMDLINSDNLDEVLLKSVNNVVYELNLLAGFITLRKGSRLYAQVTTDRSFNKFVFQLIGKPFNNLYVDIEKDINNLCVKCFNKKKIYVTTSLVETTVPAISESVAKLMARITDFKSGIVFPIIYKDKCIGTFFVGKNYVDSYEAEIPIIEEFTKYIGEAIVKVGYKSDQ